MSYPINPLQSGFNLSLENIPFRNNFTHRSFMKLIFPFTGNSFKDILMSDSKIIIEWSQGNVNFTTPGWNFENVHLKIEKENILMHAR